jgi:hypothetical protein
MAASISLNKGEIFVPKPVLPSSEYRFVRPGEDYKVEAKNVESEFLLLIEPTFGHEEPPEPLFRRSAQVMQPVKVEENKIVTNINAMKIDAPYLVMLSNRLFAIRKTKEGIIETYEFREEPEIE